MQNSDALYELEFLLRRRILEAEEEMRQDIAREAQRFEDWKFFRYQNMHNQTHELRQALANVLKDRMRMETMRSLPVMVVTEDPATPRLTE